MKKVCLLMVAGLILGDCFAVTADACRGRFRSRRNCCRTVCCNSTSNCTSTCADSSGQNTWVEAAPASYSAPVGSMNSGIFVPSEPTPAVDCGCGTQPIGNVEGNWEVYPSGSETTPMVAPATSDEDVIYSDSDEGTIVESPASSEEDSAPESSGDVVPDPPAEN